MFFRKEAKPVDKYRSVFQHTAVVRQEFNICYVPMLECVGPEAIELIIKAMRCRQAFILPKGAKVEDASLLSDVMTFALTASVAIEAVCDATRDHQYESNGQICCAWLDQKTGLIEVIGPQSLPDSYALLFMQRVMSDEGQGWLAKYPESLNQVILYLTKDPKSEFKSIVDLARNNGKQPAETQLETVPHTEPKTAPETGSYLDWLKAEIEAGNLSVNEQNSAVHGLSDGGVFLTVPGAFLPYAEQNNQTVKAVQNKLMRVKLHRLEGRKSIHAASLVGQDITGLIVDAGLELAESDYLKCRFNVKASPNLSGRGGAMTGDDKKPTPK